MARDIRRIGIILLVICAVFLVYGAAVSQAHAAKPAVYSYAKIDKSRTCDGGTVYNYFKYPKLKPSSKGAKKINAALRKKARNFVKAIDMDDAVYSLDQYAQSYGKSDFYHTAKGKVTYNKKGVISIRVTDSWYMGGVTDYGNTGYTFKLKSGKKLKVMDVIASKYAKAGVLRSKIAKKLTSKYGSEIADGFKTRYSTAKALKNVNFYLNGKGKVVICFRKYDIAAGYLGTQSVTMPSRF